MVDHFDDDIDKDYDEEKDADYNDFFLSDEETYQDFEDEDFINTRNKKEKSNKNYI